MPELIPFKARDTKTDDPRNFRFKVGHRTYELNVKIAEVEAKPPAEVVWINNEPHPSAEKD